jgi:AraC family transcriptional regulator, regulatory protein of adaptative response / methylated-DNA-[protein]-cysteine methyltransferase
MEKNHEVIGYQTGGCVLGSLLVAISERGVCAILLGDDADGLVRDLYRRFPRARLVPVPVDGFAGVADLMASPRHRLDLTLDLRGSEFDVRVWHALQEIPAGTLETYSEIAKRVGAPGAAKEVGEACAANSLAVVVPCHRVVRKDGTLAGYRWGAKRKLALLRLEGVRLGPTPDLFERANAVH